MVLSWELQQLPVLLHAGCVVIKHALHYRRVSLVVVQLERAKLDQHDSLK